MASTEIPVKIWGCRGSIPSPLYASQVRDKVEKALELASGRSFKDRAELKAFVDALPFEVSGTYGGNTSCVELGTGIADEYLILDAGSGLKDFAEQYAQRHPSGRPATFHILMSHLHWDHIQGFPFFGPAYAPENKVIFYGYHDDTERLFRAQVDDAWFPVEYGSFKAEIEFRTMSSETPFEVCGYAVKSMRQNHPGAAYGYRLEKGGKAIVYSTDAEHQLEDVDDNYRFVEFFKNADLLIFDAQYTLRDNVVSKQNWGHSNNVVATELAMRSAAKRLLIFHHDPENKDTKLSGFLMHTRDYAEIVKERFAKVGRPVPALKIDLAYDGLEILVN